MLIRDRLAERPTLSFEFFPPPDGLGFWDLRGTIGSLRSLSPDFVSVTCPAKRSAPTTELAARIKQGLHIESMAHLTCAGDSDSLTKAVDDIHRRGIGNVLALRGDGGREMAFGHADELIRFIRQRHPGMCVAAACHPETHPEAPSREADLENLKRKVDAGVDFLITQLFFDNANFLAFRDRATAAGITVPIVAGIMPVLDAKQVKRFAEMCGARVPSSLLARIESVGDDTEAVRHIGMFHATQQCLGLLREGVAGLHFYTLNSSAATKTIFQYIKSEL